MESSVVPTSAASSSTFNLSLFFSFLVQVGGALTPDTVDEQKTGDLSANKYENKPVRRYSGIVSEVSQAVGTTTKQTRVP
jgi:hypothetical protein